MSTSRYVQTEKIPKTWEEAIKKVEDNALARAPNPQNYKVLFTIDSFCVYPLFFLTFVVFSSFFIDWLIFNSVAYSSIPLLVRAS
jgi:hypothetical protein